MPKPVSWFSYHKAAAWISRSDCCWRTSRRAIRQVSDLATWIRFLYVHRPMIDHRRDLLDTPLVAPEGFSDASQGKIPAQGLPRYDPKETAQN